MRYLHEDAEGVYHLDHRLTPEVRAMFCAMSSRMPAGGIVARYQEVIEAVAEDLLETAGWPTLAAMRGDSTRGGDLRDFFDQAEKRLTTYPLHPKVQVFFDQFVGMYGHSSIMELTGSPSVYMEGISWYDAWLTFDNPLVAGQEFSTRAVRHKDWPMARSCYRVVECMFGTSEAQYVGSIPPRTEFKADEPLPKAFADIEMKKVRSLAPHPELKELHADWFEVNNAEVEWWKDHLSVAANREALGIADKEPFRPALDRARGTIPGTFATGCAHTGNLRTMARVLQVGSLLAQRGKADVPQQVWADMQKGYEAAVPGIAEMGLREAVYGEATRLPAHLLIGRVDPGSEVELRLLPSEYRRPVSDAVKARQEGERTYLDASLNQHLLVEVAFQCSLAVARDWHRHRAMFPWFLDLVRSMSKDIQLHPAYVPRSELGIAEVPGLLRRSTEVYDSFMAEDNQMQAVLALPMGTHVQMRGTGGLRDVVYMLELRAHAHGANFEYKAQAEEAIRQLRDQLGVLGRPQNQKDSLLDLVGI